MPQSGKLARLFLVLLVIVSLALASAAAYLLQQEMKKSASLNEKLTAVLSQQKSIQSTLDTSKQDLSRLNTLLSQSEEKVKQLHENITTLEDEKKTLAEDLIYLKTKLESVQKENSASLKLTENLKKEAQEKQQQLESISKEKEGLLAKLSSLELKTSQAVRLDKIVVRPQGGVLTGLEARVASIDKKFKFLIIDKGQKDSVTVGDVFVCFNKDKEIGQVEVEKVYESLSSARFLPNLDVKNLREGSKAVRR